MIFSKKIKFKLLSIIITLLATGTTPSLFAQNIPPSVEKEAEQIRQEIQAYSDSVWQAVKPTVMKQARNGRPYVPYASVPAHFQKSDIPAFPGAEGGGAHTPGGRGGEVYVVTTLADSGPGTLREALEAGGARIVVFNVAGIIRLKKPISIRAPYITIAGQTAPGDGICVAGASVKIDAHDVIIRHMRFRRGVTDAARQDDALGARGPGVGNIILDHVSASWGLDENLSLYRNIFKPGPDADEQKLPAVNITIQNSISSEALNTYSHGYGSTIGGINSTFIRNLWANNISRNPSIGMWGDFNLINNVLFNWWNRSVDGGGYRSVYNIINNYYKPGPITPMDEPEAHRILEVQHGAIDSLAWGRTYASGNHVVGFPEITENNWAGGIQIDDMSYNEAKEYFDYIRTKRPTALQENVRIRTAEEAYHYVLKHAGATIPRRDPVDRRIIKQVRTGKINNTEGEIVDTGSEYGDRRLADDSYKRGIIVDPSQVGGYPKYEGEPYTDSDSDGMPDKWEKKYGLNSNDPSDASGDLNGDGYTNIEMYINGIDPANQLDWSDPAINYDTLSEKGQLMGN